jgi:3'(2'), 5'-bisphosphate nucleotidase
MHYKEVDINELAAIAIKAGEEIMQVYAGDFSIEIKGDKSPLTEADKRSNNAIIQNLKLHYPDIPVISEETVPASYSERQYWNRFWLIDPLDGTKEFIKRNGEFTVNIALIENGIPVIGIVSAPALDNIYAGVSGLGSFKSALPDISWQAIANNIHYRQKKKVVVVASRSHLSDETLQFVETLKAEGKQVEYISSGSSLKFCLVAEGKADVYPRFGPTMEWDTGAAHAVALYAGKQVLNSETGKSLQYNKENLLNPWFIVE